MAKSAKYKLYRSDEKFGTYLHILYEINNDTQLTFKLDIKQIKPAERKELLTIIADAGCMPTNTISDSGASFKVNFQIPSTLNLTKQDILFNDIFRYLNNIGYSDLNNPNIPQSIKDAWVKISGKTQQPLGGRNFKIGDILYSDLTGIPRTIYKISSIDDGLVAVQWLDKNGSLKTMDGWKTINELDNDIEEGTYPKLVIAVGDIFENKEKNSTIKIITTQVGNPDIFLADYFQISTGLRTRTGEIAKADEFPLEMFEGGFKVSTKGYSTAATVTNPSNGATMISLPFSVGDFFYFKKNYGGKDAWVMEITSIDTNTDIVEVELNATNQGITTLKYNIDDLTQKFNNGECKKIILRKDDIFTNDEKNTNVVISGTIGNDSVTYDTVDATSGFIKTSSSANGVDSYQLLHSLCIKGYYVEQIGSDRVIDVDKCVLVGNYFTEKELPSKIYKIDKIAFANLIVTISWVTEDGVETLEVSMEDSRTMFLGGDWVLLEPNVGNVFSSLDNKYVNKIIETVDKDGFIEFEETTNKGGITKKVPFQNKWEGSKNEFYINQWKLVQYGDETPSATIDQDSQPQTNKFKDSELLIKLGVYKQQLADAIALRADIDEVEFEERVEMGTLIAEIQRKIDEINFYLLEEAVSENNIFDELFEQSFTPIQARYDDIVLAGSMNDYFAPNGEKSDLSEGLNEVIRMPEFKEWFGDWEEAYFYRNVDDAGLHVSTVLSEKYEPLVVWHGTGGEFANFRFDQFPAAYFAANRKYSDFFAEIHSQDGKGYVMPFFLDIKNPLDLSHFKNDYVSHKSFFDWMYLCTGLSPSELDLNPMFLDKNMKPLPIWMYLRNNPKMLQKLSDTNLFDGISFYEFNPNMGDASNPAYETKAYIIFSPENAKMASPRRGKLLLASMKSFLLKRGGLI